MSESLENHPNSQMRFVSPIRGAEGRGNGSRFFRAACRLSRKSQIYIPDIPPNPFKKSVPGERTIFLSKIETRHKIVGMGDYRSVRGKLAAVVDWLGLALMAFSSPVTAYLLILFDICLRFYLEGAAPPILTAVGYCGIPAIPTLLVLLCFRKRCFYRWLAWAICTFVWLLALFWMSRE